MGRVQLHLVTLVALSFSAAGLLWLNVRCSPGMAYISSYDVAGGNFVPIWRDAPSVGWPRAFVIPDYQAFFIEHSPGMMIPYFVPAGPSSGRHNVRYVPLLMDVAAGLGILLSVAVLCEWVVRRRSQRPATRVQTAMM